MSLRLNGCYQKQGISRCSKFLIAWRTWRNHFVSDRDKAKNLVPKENVPSNSKIRDKYKWICPKIYLFWTRWNTEWFFDNRELWSKWATKRTGLQKPYWGRYERFWNVLIPRPASLEHVSRQIALLGLQYLQEVVAGECLRVLSRPVASNRMMVVTATEQTGTYVAYATSSPMLTQHLEKPHVTNKMLE